MAVVQGLFLGRMSASGGQKMALQGKMERKQKNWKKAEKGVDNSDCLCYYMQVACESGEIVLPNGGWENEKVEKTWKKFLTKWKRCAIINNRCGNAACTL